MKLHVLLHTGGLVDTVNVHYINEDVWLAIYGSQVDKRSISDEFQ